MIKEISLPYEKTIINEKCIKGFEISNFIAKGGYGSVYNICKPTLKDDCNYVVKIIDISQEKEEEDFTKEVTLNQILNKKNIGPKIDGAYTCMDKNNIKKLGIIIQEKWDSDLRGYEKYLSNYLIDKLSDQINTLHKLNYIHLDLLPKNILINKIGEIPVDITISDFGITTEYTKNYTVGKYFVDYYRENIHVLEKDTELMNNPKLLDYATLNYLKYIFKDGVGKLIHMRDDIFNIKASDIHRYFPNLLTKITEKFINYNISNNDNIYIYINYEKNNIMSIFQLYSEENNKIIRNFNGKEFNKTILKHLIKENNTIFIELKEFQDNYKKLLGFFINRNFDKYYIINTIKTEAIIVLKYEKNNILSDNYKIKLLDKLSNIDKLIYKMTQENYNQYIIQNINSDKESNIAVFLKLNSIEIYALSVFSIDYLYFLIEYFDINSLYMVIYDFKNKDNLLLLDEILKLNFGLPILTEQSRSQVQFNQKLLCLTYLPNVNKNILESYKVTSSNDIYNLILSYLDCKISYIIDDKLDEKYGFLKGTYNSETNKVILKKTNIGKILYENVKIMNDIKVYDLIQNYFVNKTFCKIILIFGLNPIQICLSFDAMQILNNFNYVCKTRIITYFYKNPSSTTATFKDIFANDNCSDVYTEFSKIKLFDITDLSSNPISGNFSLYYKDCLCLNCL